MVRHILLLFLSDVKTRVENGHAVVSAAQYRIAGQSVETRTTNGSAIRYLLADTWRGQRIAALDRIFVFASAKVRTEYIRTPGKEPLLLEVDGTPITHLDYFRHCLQEVLPNAAACLPEDAVYPYEESEPVEKAMGMVADMAERIRRYMQAVAGDEVVLHADCTGGMRHANMMMLGVMRLLQYQGVEIGRVLYSKYDSQTQTGEVQQADEIYHLFDLIAGSEEFVRFGSVAAIQGYFAGREKPAEMQALLDAMERFAKEIKLCHRGRFQQAVGALGRALDDFTQAQPAWRDEEKGTALDRRQVHDKWMRQLQARIRRDYGRLFDGTDHELAPIRWCLEHDYLQQAITLYTECLPEFLCELPRGLVFVDEEQRQAVENCRDKKDRRSFNFFLLNIYELKPHALQEDIVEDDARREAALDVMQGKWKMEVTRLLGRGRYEVAEVRQRLEKFLAESPGVYLEDWRQLESMLETIRGLQENPAVLLCAPETLQDVSLQQLVQVYSDWCSKKRLPIWESEDAGQRFKALLNYLKASMTKKSAERIFGRLSVDYAQGFLHLLRAGLVSTRLPAATLCSILNRYARIKAERNFTNHAKLEHGIFQTPEALRDYMSYGLDELEAAAARYGSQR